MENSGTLLNEQQVEIDQLKLESLLTFLFGYNSPFQGEIDLIYSIIY